MSKGIGKNTGSLLSALVNLMGTMFRQHPIIFLTFIGIIGYATFWFTTSSNKMTFFLCILISLVSIVLYSKTNNYAETLMSFMIGVLTIFTINWDSINSKIFIAFYIGINIFLFFISSIKVATKVETELTIASSFIDNLNFKATYQRLDAICKIPTTYNLISNLDKAEIIKYLSYMKLPIENMKEAINNIETIKVVLRLTLEESCNFFRAIYFIQIRALTSFTVTNFLDIIMAKRLPITPNELMNIVDQTKKILISKKINILEYLDKIEELTLNGLSDEEIIIVIRDLN